MLKSGKGWGGKYEAHLTWEGSYSNIGASISDWIHKEISMSKVKDRIGMRLESNSYGWFEVVGRDGYNYVIRFDHAGYEMVARWDQICRGEVRNPFYPMSYGVGYLGEASSSHPFYSRWQPMLARCYDPENSQYPDYGGRGIKVDPELHSFENYITLLESLDGYDDPELDTIDRIDNNDGYRPGNLRWASQKEQAANRRRRKDSRDFIATDPDGVEHLGRNQPAFAKLHDLNASGLNMCLKGDRKTHKGWTFRYKDA